MWKETCFTNNPAQKYFRSRTSHPWGGFFKARICKPCKEPRNRFPAIGPYLSDRPAMLHRPAESNPRNWFLVSLNVYKYGLSSAILVGNPGNPERQPFPPLKTSLLCTHTSVCTSQFHCWMRELRNHITEIQERKLGSTVLSKLKQSEHKLKTRSPDNTLRFIRRQRRPVMRGPEPTAILRISGLVPSTEFLQTKETALISLIVLAWNDNVVF